MPQRPTPAGVIAAGLLVLAIAGCGSAATSSTSPSPAPGASVAPAASAPGATATASTSAPAAASASSGPTAGTIYVVRKGDTLVGIAKKAGISLKALRKANPKVTDPTKLRVGDRLTIPSQ